jgi:hypothetical protein
MKTQIGLLEILWNDLRYSAKMLQKTPCFTLAAVLTLGLGIGINTAIYSGINAIFFKPLAGVQNPEQLCRIKLLHQSGGGFEWVPYPDYLEIKQRNRDYSETVEIVGVAKDVKHHSLMEEQAPYIYQPVEHYFGYQSNYMVLFVRTHRDPAATLPALAKLIRSLDPEAVFEQSTMDEALQRKILPVKIASAFFGIFGTMALILASVGLLGVIGYSVARRKKEIGIRMALGADRNNVLRMIIGEGLGLAFTGIVIGLLAAAGLTRVLARFLYGISHLDPISYGSTILVLLMAALLACYFPARKASKVDPMYALRQE